MLYVAIQGLMIFLSGDVRISVTYGHESSHQCLYDNNDDVTLTCTVNPLTTLIDWYHDTTNIQYCSNLNGNCRPPGGTTTNPRHTFSSSISNGVFTLSINPVIPGTDAGVYKCEHGSAADSDSVTLDACGKFSLYFKNISLMQVMFRSV